MDDAAHPPPQNTSDACYLNQLPFGEDGDELSPTLRALTKCLEFLPELRPRQAWPTAHEDVRMSLALLVVHAQSISVVPRHPARGKRPLNVVVR